MASITLRSGKKVPASAAKPKGKSKGKKALTPAAKPKGKPKGRKALTSAAKPKGKSKVSEKAEASTTSRKRRGRPPGAKNKKPTKAQISTTNRNPTAKPKTKTKISSAKDFHDVKKNASKKRGQEKAHSGAEENPIDLSSSVELDDGNFGELIEIGSSAEPSIDGSGPKPSGDGGKGRKGRKRPTPDPEGSGDGQDDDGVPD